MFFSRGKTYISPIEGVVCPMHRTFVPGSWCRVPKYLGVFRVIRTSFIVEAILAGLKMSTE